MNDKTKIKQLKDLSNELYSSYVELQRKVRRLEELPIARSLVGLCFKHREQIGNHSWWSYKHIFRLDEANIHLISEQFQETDESQITFSLNRWTSLYISATNTPITYKEYYTAKKRLLNKLLRRLEKEKP